MWTSKTHNGADCEPGHKLSITLTYKHQVNQAHQVSVLSQQEEAVFFTNCDTVQLNNQLRGSIWLRSKGFWSLKFAKKNPNLTPRILHKQLNFLKMRYIFKSCDFNPVFVENDPLDSEASGITPTVQCLPYCPFWSSHAGLWRVPGKHCIWIYTGRHPMHS